MKANYLHCVADSNYFCSSLYHPPTHVWKSKLQDHQLLCLLKIIELSFQMIILLIHFAIFVNLFCHIYFFALFVIYFVDSLCLLHMLFAISCCKCFGFIFVVGIMLTLDIHCECRW